MRFLRSGKPSAIVQPRPKTCMVRLSMSIGLPQSETTRGSIGRRPRLRSSLPSALDAPELALHPVAPVFEAAPAPVEAAPLPLTSAASDVTLKLSQIELPQPASSTSRTPIDPSLPPNHPLEPGSLPGRSRQSPSAADRIAASEAVIGSKPPVIADPGGGKPDFIAAARRAAQAASASHDDRKITRTGGTSTTQPKKLTERLRTLAVAAAVVVIVVGGFHVISRIFEDGSGAPTPAQAPPAQTAPEGQTEAPRPQSQPPQAQPDQPPRKEPPHVEAEPLAAPACDSKFSGRTGDNSGTAA